MGLSVFLFALLCVFVAFSLWLSMSLLRQTGRLLLRVEALEAQLRGEVKPAPEAPAMPAGLELGSEAPEFELPDLTGNVHTLSSWRGKRVLLIFFNPRCGYCAKMAPDLATLPVDGEGRRPIPLLVTTSDVDANRTLLDQHDVRCTTLLQQTSSEVAAQYGARGTPMGCVIDEEGRIASQLAIGAAAVLQLSTDPPVTLPPAAKKTYQGNRTLADSKINRSGLTAGTQAPGFTLPTLDGGELSLADYEGQRVLLVFSAPDCIPCCDLAPQLERRRHERPDLQVLMVSRGDADANRLKAKEHALTFPIALQRQWEISKLYGMFVTPMAYLLDEHGVIACDVAVGVEPILDLLSHSTTSAQHRPDDFRKEAKVLAH